MRNSKKNNQFLRLSLKQENAKGETEAKGTVANESVALHTNKLVLELNNDVVFGYKQYFTTKMYLSIYIN